MKFSYTDYRFTNYYLPLLLSLVLVLMEIPMIISIYRDVSAVIKGQLDVTSLFSFRIIIGILVFVFLFGVVINPLVHGGFRLREEFETDAVIASGVIEEIKVLGPQSGQKYRLENKTTFGARLRINGVEYTVMDTGDLYLQEAVGFTYLPKSHFILSIWDATGGAENASSG